MAEERVLLTETDKTKVVTLGLRVSFPLEDFYLFAEGHQINKPFEELTKEELIEFAIGIVKPTIIAKLGNPRRALVTNSFRAQETAALKEIADGIESVTDVYIIED